MFVADAPPEPGLDVLARGDELAEQARALASQIAQSQAQLVDVFREVDGLSGRLGERPRAWFARRVGLTTGEAARTGRLAGRLGELPVLADAFAAGRLSEGTVELLCRVATPDNETALVATAEVATASQLASLIAHYQRIRTKDNDPVATPEERFTSTIGPNGYWQAQAQLRPDRGALVDAAIAAVINAEKPDENTGERISQPEALVQVAQRSLTADHADGYTPTTAHVVIRVDADKINPDRTITDDGAHVTTGGPIDLDTLEELLCDCLHSVIRTKDHNPLTETSPSRLATPAQRRALLVRDGHCQYPGCGRTRHLIAHHIHFHTDGGPTHIDNLLLLCQTHHGRIHRKGWTLKRAPDGHVTVTRPCGRTIAHTHPPRPPGIAPPDPQPRPRATGERLTNWATDTILANWLQATPTG